MDNPQFMSPAHVAAMNAILHDAPEVLAVCRSLDRHYTLCYDLSDGPDGESVHWSMVFDPEMGVRMGLDGPQGADLVILGDWSEAIRSAMAQRRGETHDADFELRGDPKVMESVGSAYAAAQQVASLDVTFPELGES